jgi:hypothetical protein
MVPSHVSEGNERVREGPDLLDAVQAFLDQLPPPSPDGRDSGMPRRSHLGSAANSRDFDPRSLDRRTAVIANG